MAKNDLVRRIDLENFSAVSASTPTGTGAPPHYFATYTVAAVDSTPAEIAGADFVCDGTADEVEIGLALASKIGGYARVLLLSGTFTLSANVTFTYDNCTLEGQGTGTKVICNGGYIFINTRVNCKVANMQIGGIFQPGIYLTSCANCEISGCTLDGFYNATDGTFGYIRAISCTDCRVINNHLSAALTLGIDTFYAYAIFANACTNLVITGNTIDFVISGSGTSKNGVTLWSCYRCAITGNTITLAGNALSDTGIDLEDQTFDPLAYNGQHAIAGNTVKGWQIGIVCNAAGSTITGNVIKSCVSAIRNYMLNVVIASNTVTGALSTESEGEWLGDFGIILDAGNLYNGDSYYPMLCTIIGNSIMGFGAAGIFLDGGANQNTIIGNFVGGNSWTQNVETDDENFDGRGIIFQDANDNYITGNHVANQVDPLALGVQKFEYELKGTCTGNRFLDNYDSGNPFEYHAALGKDDNTHGNTAVYKGAFEIINIVQVTDGNELYAGAETNSVLHLIAVISGVPTTFNSFHSLYPVWDGREIFLYAADPVSRPITLSQYVSGGDNLDLGGSDLVMGGVNTGYVHLKYFGSFWHLVGNRPYQPPTTLTIAGGVVTITGEYHLLAPQTGTSDDLDTINGYTNGFVLRVRTTPSNTITLKNGTGNLSIGADIALSSTSTIQTLIYDATLAKWLKAA